MAFILITDNPQGGACRCEGQAQALDLSKLSSEQVEALKQALGINASQGAGQPLDLANLSPEQIEALKQALGVNTAASGADINSLLKAEIDSSAFSGVEGAENIEYSGIFLGGRSTAHVIWNLDTKNSMIQSALGNLIQDLILKGVIKHSDYKGCLGNWIFSDIPE